jgi:REP element-mobilizing transposase RayT
MLPEFPLGLQVRRSLRLPGFDYSRAGAYFVTIGTWRRQPLFASIDRNRVMLTGAGQVVAEEWKRTAECRPYVRLDEMVVMPDHMHGILHLTVEARPLGTVIGGFKSAVARRIGLASGRRVAVWQRGYHERVVRTEAMLAAARAYIRENPARWFG